MKRKKKGDHEDTINVLVETIRSTAEKGNLFVFMQQQWESRVPTKIWKWNSMTFPWLICFFPWLSLSFSHGFRYGYDSVSQHAPLSQLESCHSHENRAIPWLFHDIQLLFMTVWEIRKIWRLFHDSNFSRIFHDRGNPEKDNMIWLTLLRLSWGRGHLSPWNCLWNTSVSGIPPSSGHLKKKKPPGWFHANSTSPFKFQIFQAFTHYHSAAE